MARRSTYLIALSDDQKGQFVFVNGLTGSIDIVSDRIFRLVNNDEIHNLKEAETQYLFRKGYITTRSRKDEFVYVTDLCKKLFIDSYRITFVFCITYDCNLRCDYCFEKKFASEVLDKSLGFSVQRVDAAFRAIDLLKEKYGLNKTITLYGGEPLLSTNSEVIAAIVDEGAKRGFKFSLLTNGLNVNLYKEYFPHKIGHVQVSLHNKTCLIPAEGKASIGESVDLLINKGVNTYLRVHVTDDSVIERMLELDEALSAYRWDRKSNFHCYLSPIRDNSEKGTPQFSKIIQKINAAGRSELLRKHRLVGVESNVYSQLDRILKGEYFSYGRFCSASQMMHIFTPDGRIYSCYEAVGSNSHAVGEFYPQYLLDTHRMTDWRRTALFERKNCIECPYILWCGGGCAFRTMSETGECQPLGFCDNYPLMFKNAIFNYIEASELQSENSC